MLEHHLQRSIIANLVEKKAARFAELRPKNVDSNVFTYHLRTLMTQKLVQKQDGQYCLTSKGKLLGINVSLNAGELLEQAHSILLLAVRDSDSWLLRKRLVQPMFDKTGFIHGEPRAGETVEAAADRILKRRTGLSAKFEVKGSGFISLWQDKQLESYTHFVLLEANKTAGELIEKDNHGENIWLKNPDFESTGMIPSMPRLAALLVESSNLFFADLSIGL